MSFLFRAANHSYEGALIAPVDDCRALVLMGKELLIRQNLLATFIRMAALKLYLAKQISCHSIHSVKLTFVSAKWACVWVSLEPLGLTIAAERLFANNAFDWIFEHIVANSTNELS